MALVDEAQQNASRHGPRCTVGAFLDRIDPGMVDLLPSLW